MLSLLLFAFVLAWSCASPAGALLVRRSLSGADWRVFNTNGSVSVAARVPGVVHLDLLAAGVIGDPYYRYNEREQAWIWREPYWNYTRSLSVSADLLAHSAVEAVFDGLDTAALVFVNGRLVHQSANQFRRFTVDLRTALVAGDNELTVAFHSPVLHAQAAYDSYPYDVPGPMPQKADPSEALPYR